MITEWRAILVRESTSWQGTPGTLFIHYNNNRNTKRFCRTLELPWRNNAVGLSCIPTGTYTCRWTYSPKYKRNMYLLEGVENRSGIRIHSASFAGAADKGYLCHLLGCISLGKGFLGGPGTNQQLLLHTSRVTTAKFEEFTEQKDFILQIVGELEPCQ